MAKKAPLPKSRAKTAYGLLGEIKRLILAEPKRYNQRVYLEKRGPLTLNALPLNPKDAPPCGTRACVAGCVATLKTRHPRYHEAAYIAGHILGLTYKQKDQLFNGGAASGIPGTALHARSGAKHIANFQKRHADQLKATRV